jgi:16S rRNA G1207 methylase RsmC
VKFLKTLKAVSGSQVGILNPGQGHIPVVLARLFHPVSMALIDRDLLALRISKINLTLNGYPAGNPDNQIDIHHEVGIIHSAKGNYDLLVLLLREEEGNEANLLTLRQAADRLLEQGTLLVTASSTSVTRLADKFRYFQIRARTRERWKGLSLVVLERT